MWVHPSKTGSFKGPFTKKKYTSRKMHSPNWDIAIPFFNFKLLYDFPSTMIIMLIENVGGLVYRHWLFGFFPSGVRRSSRRIFREVQSNCRSMSKKKKKPKKTQTLISTENITEWLIRCFHVHLEMKTAQFHLQSFKCTSKKSKKWSIWHAPSS